MSKPWITFGIKTSIGVKQKLYEKYLKSGNTYYLTTCNIGFTATKLVALLITVNENTTMITSRQTVKILEISGMG